MTDFVPGSFVSSRKWPSGQPIWAHDASRPVRWRWKKLDSAEEGGSKIRYSENPTLIQQLPEQLIKKIDGIFGDAPHNAWNIVGWVDGFYIDVSKPVLDVWLKTRSKKNSDHVTPTRSELGVDIKLYDRNGDEMKIPEGVAEGAKPVCPDHYEEMPYDPVTGYWVCPNFACERKARRRLSIEDVEGHVVTGDMHLYSTGTGKEEQFYIYIRQLNVFIDVTPRVTRDSSGIMHDASTYHLGLLFDKLHNRD